jgi:hypothetical protein
VSPAGHAAIVRLAPTLRHRGATTNFAAGASVLLGAGILRPHLDQPEPLVEPHRDLVPTQPQADADAFDRGGIISALIGVVIVLLVVGFVMRRVGGRHGPATA